MIFSCFYVDRQRQCKFQDYMDEVASSGFSIEQQMVSTGQYWISSTLHQT